MRVGSLSQEVHWQQVSVCLEGRDRKKCQTMQSDGEKSGQTEV